jgi:hypothetical protein
MNITLLRNRDERMLTFPKVSIRVLGDAPIAAL